VIWSRSRSIQSPHWYKAVATLSAWTREEKERRKEDIDSLDMEEDGLDLEYRFVNEVFLAVDCFELDIAKSAIDEGSHVVRGIIVGDWGVRRSGGGGKSRGF
jgi:hypothetical protein